jgi:hypothetical protein
MGRIILPPSLLGVKSKQDFVSSITGSGITTSNLAISSVDLNNSLLLLNGSGVWRNAVLGDADPIFLMARAELSSATNILMTKNSAFSSAASFSRVSGQVLEFNAGVLKRSVQRGSVVIPTTVNGTDFSTGTIFTAPTNIAKTFLNVCGISTTLPVSTGINIGWGIPYRVTLNTANDGLDLQINGQYNTNSAITVSYEVWELL